MDDGHTSGRDTWPDPLTASGEGPAAERPAVDHRDTRSLAGTRLRLLVGAVVVAVVVRTVWGLVLVRDGDPRASGVTYFVSSSVFFIGLPALLAWLLLRRAPAETAMGRVLTGTTVGLLLTAMVLGEGAICVALAAPLVYVVAWAVTAAWERWDARGRHLAVVALLVPLLPGTTGGVEEVHVGRELPVSVAAVHAAIADGPQLTGADRPWLLTLGYPVPGTPALRTQPDGADVWQFDYGHGTTRFRVERTGDAYRFVPVEDTAMRRWFAWEPADLVLTPTATGTRVELTLRFDPALGPDWYFGTVEQVFVRAAGGHLLDTLSVADGRR